MNTMNVGKTLNQKISPKRRFAVGLFTTIALSLLMMLHIYFRITAEAGVPEGWWTTFSIILALLSGALYQTTSNMTKRAKDWVRNG